jgi:hypothetical protein
MCGIRHAGERINRVISMGQRECVICERELSENCCTGDICEACAAEYGLQGVLFCLG